MFIEYGQHLFDVINYQFARTMAAKYPAALGHETVQVGLTRCHLALFQPTSYMEEVYVKDI